MEFKLSIQIIVFILPLMLVDYPANPIHKPGYSLEFNDEFSGDQLDTSKWFPYYLPQWSSRSKSMAKYELSNGYLKLKITKDQVPWCEEFNGLIKCSSFQTGVYAGSLNSSVGQHKFNPACVVREEQPTVRLYTPKFGYFEIRARAAIGANNVAAFWMIGFEDQPENSGEICIMEVKGKHVTKNKLINGHGIRKFQDPFLTDEFYDDQFSLDASKFNIYAAEWCEDKVEFFINNKKVRTIRQSPNYEMQFMLNIYELPNENGVSSTEKRYPAVLEVDYVRGYKRHID